MCIKLIDYGLKGIIGIFFMVFLYASVYADSNKIQNPSNGHWYQRFDTIMSWHEAKTFCESVGGHLATITSQAEHDFVYDNLASVSSQHCWLGATDEAQEGVWEWITNEPWDYTRWAPGEPNNCAGESYLHYLVPSLHPDSGFWNDLDEGNHGGCACNDCTSNDWHSMSTICEWEASVSGCINLDGLPIVNAIVILKQKNEPKQTTTTDSNGCYNFENVVSGKRFTITIRGPKVP